MGAGSLLLVFDIGTTALKCAVFDASGTELGSASASYPCHYPVPGWAEQDPEDFWRAALSAWGRLSTERPIDASAIEAIGLSGHMNGCLPVDADGTPLRREIIHSDSRASSERKDILSTAGAEEVYALTGNRVDEHLSLPKILWMKKNEMELYRRTAFFLNSKDYLRFKLTGRVGETDLSDASLVGALDLRAKGWAVDFLRGLGLDPGKFPVLRESSEVCGGLLVDAARALNLRSGVPVVYGGGDAACATRGAGVGGPSSAYMSLGSSAWISTLASGPAADPGMRMQHFYDLDGASCNVCGTVQCAGAAADWIAALVSATLADLDVRAAAVPPGSRGILFSPYLMGERTPHWDAGVRGSFIGLSLFHDASSLVRAVYEGVAYALRDVFSVYAELGVPLPVLTVLGGGAKSELWRGIIADVLGCPLRLHPATSSATSLGAAMAAGVGVGLFADFDAAAKVVVLGGAEEPRRENIERYDRLYRIFKKAYGRLRPLYRELAGGKE